MHPGKVKLFQTRLKTAPAKNYPFEIFLTSNSSPTYTVPTPTLVLKPVFMLSFSVQSTSAENVPGRTSKVDVRAAPETRSKPANGKGKNR